MTLKPQNWKKGQGEVNETISVYFNHSSAKTWSPVTCKNPVKIQRMVEF
jgi:hypothetical protein